MGHLIFGLPDLHDIDYSSSGAGAFCVMAAGSWGKADSADYPGQTPVLPCAFIKHDRGWVTSTAITAGPANVYAAGSASATPRNTVCKRPTSVSGEYFLVENRMPVGYDLGLQGLLGGAFKGGVAIWHVDEAMPGNWIDSHRMVDLEEADGTEMGRSEGRNTDLWYVGNRVHFNASTTPNSKLYSGASSDARIHTLTAPATVMGVKFSVGQ